MAGVKDTYYVGTGFYGGMTEQDMVKELRVRGPILFDFNANHVFQTYSSGIMSDDGMNSLEEQFNASSTEALAQVQASSDTENEVEAEATAGTVTQEDMGIQWAYLTHSTMIVGYGVEDDEKFWIVRNSYGPQWGESGNFRVRRGHNDFGCEAESIGMTPVLY